MFILLVRITNQSPIILAVKTAKVVKENAFNCKVLEKDLALKKVSECDPEY